jgi:hypothetical protein
MLGCRCATCESQRAYCKRPDVKARHAAETRARRPRLTEAEHARINQTMRNSRRRHAEARDEARLSALQGGNL